MENVIITGGAGYIGRAIVDLLNKSKEYRPIVVDQDCFKLTVDCRCVSADLTDKYDLRSLRDRIKIHANGEPIKALIHMAAWKDLPGSFRRPNEYYRNNLISTINVVELANELGIEGIIFSSSAAVYPDIDGGLVEDQAVNPPSPYGASKLMCERIITDSAKLGKFKAFNLRYQNPIGCIIGVTEDKSDSMFGSIYNSIATKTPFTIFGGDYNTPDGTCIRDYIDINDIAKIHCHMLNFFDSVDGADTLNVGRGEGVSCLQVCKIVKELYPEFEYRIGDRRIGDAAGSYADTFVLTNSYGYNSFTPIKDTIANIIELAKINQNGYV